jgi:hypothetical protein
MCVNEGIWERTVEVQKFTMEKSKEVCPGDGCDRLCCVGINRWDECVRQIMSVVCFLPGDMHVRGNERAGE